MRLLENKAIALICTGQREVALATLREALAQRLPGYIKGFHPYDTGGGSLPDRWS